ncbi:MAG: DEAD/DEAH box helicase, partial [Gemmatimonadetes bacterium]|nr:DEAD/DEAH box helicase [Gemmatimonadota bacterium]
MTEGLLEPILQSVVADDAYRRAFDRLQSGREAVLVGIACSAKSMAIAHLHRERGKPVLVVVPDQEEAEALLGDLEVVLGEERVLFFPETEVIPYDRRSPHVGILAERILTLASLADGEPAVVVTTARAIGGRLPVPDVFATFRLRLEAGGEIDRDTLAEALIARGFRAERLVEEIGTFALRGGIVDLFPFGRENPIRIEFWGDEIESIRAFDPGTQRTVESLDRVDVLPQRELLIDDAIERAARERGDLPFDPGQSPWIDGIESWLPRFHPRLGSLLEYFPADGIVVLDEPSRVEERLEESFEQARAGHEDLRRRGHDVPEPRTLFLETGDVAADLGGREILRLALFPGESITTSLRPAGAPPAPPADKMVVHSQETFRGNFAVLRERFKGFVEEGNELWLLCDNRGQLSRLEEMLEDLGDSLRLVIAPLRNGFALPSRRLVVLTDHELFARTARRTRAFRHGGGAPIHDYQSLRKGDYVVHVDHGIGRYDGIERISTGGVESECLRLRYQDGDSIFVPIDQINLVRKYVGGEGGEPPVVAKLGTAAWERTKARVRKAVEKMAEQLLEVHAARAAKRGHPYPPDGEWQREMEASFIYEETPDQRTATDAVKRDMEDARPMDRLVCGDVGYGKTEVAIRAAFKAVTDGKQVAVLVPTTILAQQHLETFRERLAAYPVRIDMLSRFRGPKEIKDTVQRVKGGEVDLVVGTHRLLS